MKTRNTGMWLRKSEAARRLNVTKRTIENYIANGTLKAYKLGGWLVIIKKEDVDALIQELQKQEQHPEEQEPSVNGTHQEED